MPYCFITFCELLRLPDKSTSPHILFLYVSINMKLLNTKEFTKRDLWHTQDLPLANRFFSRCHAYYIVVIDKLPCAFWKTIIQNFSCTRMDSVDENLVIDLIENHKLSYEQTSSVLKERFLGVRGLSFRSFRRFCSKKEYIFKSVY